MDSITQVKDLSRKDLLKERQQKLKTQLKYYQKRLEGVQNQLPSQERQRKRGRTQCDKGYYEAKILEFESRLVNLNNSVESNKEGNREDGSQEEKSGKLIVIVIVIVIVMMLMKMRMKRFVIL